MRSGLIGISALFRELNGPSLATPVLLDPFLSGKGETGLHTLYASVWQGVTITSSSLFWLGDPVTGGITRNYKIEDLVGWFMCSIRVSFEDMMLASIITSGRKPRNSYQSNLCIAMWLYLSLSQNCVAHFCLTFASLPVYLPVFDVYLL